MSGSKLELINVSKTFFPGTINERKALKDITLSLESGDFLTIIGSNGAGKSTLFNAICGSFMIDRGSILLDGKEISNMPDYKRAVSIGRLFQDPMKGTAPHLTIEENLSLAYGNKGGKHFFAVNRKNRAKFRELLSALELGLEDRMTTKIGLLSGGQRQAVSLLMATISEPKLLLLDEHTAALDPATAKKVLAITVSIVAQTQTPTMMITHDIRAALEVGTRTIMMDEGRIVLDIKGEERMNMTLKSFCSYIPKRAKKQLLNDRMLFETEKE
jgi:putative ABC transport system ATP-binding protein